MTRWQGVCLGVLLVALPAAAEQAAPAVAASKAAEAPAPAADPAGEIFGQAVPLSNYYFAKRVAYTFPSPWGAADLPEDRREPNVWDNLILSFEAYRRDIAVTDDEIEEMVDSLLKSDKQAFTRRSDPAAYAKWVQDTLHHDAGLLENEVRYLVQIRKLKDRLLEEQPAPTVTDAELQKEFLNEQNHVGGEMVVFDAQADAQAFYDAHKTAKAWERMKKEGRQKVRPVSLMTVEAYVDLWSIPQAQMDAFHDMPEGSIDGPLPFGKQWCVYRLLEKRTGDLKDFPAKRDSYVKQVTMKKKYEERNEWLENFKKSANLKVFVKN